MKIRLACALLLAACPKPPHPLPADVQLDPPPVGRGFQLATPAYDVAAGTEDQRCIFFEAPADETWVNRIVTAVNPGSHHMNLFRVRTLVGLSGKPGDVVVNGECFKSPNWADWPLVTNQQDSSPGRNVTDWTLPDGVAQHFAPHELLMLQVHFVNASPRSMKLPTAANLIFFDQAKVATFFSWVCVSATSHLATSICARRFATPMAAC